MYNLKSKKTGKMSVVDKETIDNLTKSGQLKKFEVTKLPEPKKLIPEEIIKKSKNKEND